MQKYNPEDHTVGEVSRSQDSRWESYLNRYNLRVATSFRPCATKNDPLPRKGSVAGTSALQDGRLSAGRPRHISDAKACPGIIGKYYRSAAGRLVPGMRRIRQFVIAFEHSFQVVPDLGGTIVVKEIVFMNICSAPWRSPPDDAYRDCRS